jgi:hypothetical protein
VAMGRRPHLILRLDTEQTAPGRGLRLEPYGCVIAKHLAGRDKDLAFADALVRGGIADLAAPSGCPQWIQPTPTPWQTSECPRGSCSGLSYSRSRTSIHG